MAGRHQLQNPWPQIKRPEPPKMTAEELSTGHPSAPGYREPDEVPRGPVMEVADGVPGVPKIRLGRRGQKGFPMSSGTSAPMQPDIFYENTEGEEDDST